jgi:hypothetical protein
MSRKLTTFRFSLQYQRLAGGESVSQPPLKDKVFSTFLDQNPPFELRGEWGFSSKKVCNAVFRDWWRRRLPSEGKGHTFESCRVRQFFLFCSGICVPGLKLQLCVIRVRKRLDGKSEAT